MLGRHQDVGTDIVNRSSICLLTVLFLGQAQAQVLTSIPVSAANDSKAFWGAVMQEFYGGYDKSLKCWIGGDTEKLCMRPHMVSTVANEGGPKHLVAMAGYAVTPDGERADCHACGGKLGLVVLQERDGRLALVARNSLAGDAGSWGTVPPEEAFRVVALGKGNHGWLMEFFYTGQGYTEGGVQVFGAIGDRIVDLGFISTHSDNGGACGEGMADCYVHSYEILTDHGGSTAAFGDLVARKVESSDQDAASAFRIAFSRDELKYIPPEALAAQLGN